MYLAFSFFHELPFSNGDRNLTKSLGTANQVVTTEPPPQLHKSMFGEKKKRVLFMLKFNLRIFNQVCWCMHVIPALGRLRQEDPEFKARIDHIGRPCLKKRKWKEIVSPVMVVHTCNPSTREAEAGRCHPELHIKILSKKKYF
jgi:hypothetical protein